MSSVHRFPFKVQDVDHCPDPFQDSLRRAVTSADNVSEIIYSPSFVGGKASLPASVLCLSNRQWVIVHKADKRALEVAQAGFTDTLFVELTVVLLYGKLRIGYAGKDRSGSGVCYFNTVMEGLYTNAIEQVLNSIDGVWPPSEERDKKIMQDLKDWPLKFRNYGWFHLPPGSKLLKAVNWPTVFGRFGREFAAAGALFLTDRHLVIITEERSRSWFQKREDRTRYGAIITYLPLARISGFRIHERRWFRILELRAQAAHGAEKTQVLFSTEYETEVTRLLGDSLQQHAVEKQG